MGEACKKSFTQSVILSFKANDFVPENGVTVKNPDFCMGNITGRFVW
jgi:hypothetical protein